MCRRTWLAALIGVLAGAVGGAVLSLRPWAEITLPEPTQLIRPDFLLELMRSSLPGVTRKQLSSAIPDFTHTGESSAWRYVFVVPWAGDYPDQRFEAVLTFTNEDRVGAVSCEWLGKDARSECENVLYGRHVHFLMEGLLSLKLRSRDNVIMWLGTPDGTSRDADGPYWMYQWSFASWVSPERPHPNKLYGIMNIGFDGRRVIYVRWQPK